MPNLNLHLSSIRLSVTPTPTTSFSAFTQTPPLTATYFAISTTPNRAKTTTPFTTPVSSREHVLDWTHHWSENLPDRLALQNAKLTILALRPRTHGCVPFNARRKPREIGVLTIPFLQIVCGTVCHSHVLQRPDGRGGTVDGPLTLSFNISVEQACSITVSLRDLTIRPAHTESTPFPATADEAHISLASPDGSAERSSPAKRDGSTLIWQNVPDVTLLSPSFLQLIHSSLTISIHGLSEETQTIQLPLHSIWVCMAHNTNLKLNLPLQTATLNCIVSTSGTVPIGQMVGGVTTDLAIVGARPVVFGWVQLVDSFGYRYYYHLPSQTNVWTTPVERSAKAAILRDEVSAQTCGYIRGKHAIFRCEEDGNQSETWIHPAASRFSTPSFSHAVSDRLEESGGDRLQLDHQHDDAHLHQDPSPPTSLSTLDFSSRDLSNLHPAAFTRLEPGPSSAPSSTRTSREKPRGIVVEMRWTHLSQLFSRSGEGTEGHTLTAVNKGASMLKFGGAFGAGGLRSNNLHSFDVANRSWRVLSPSGVAPTPRTGHGAVAMGSDLSRLLIFGGSSPQGRLNDLHMFHVEDQTWSPVACMGTPPGIRSRLGMAATSDGATAIVFGGRSLYRYLGGKYYDPLHLHAFHAERSEWVQLTPQGSSKYPAPRSGCVVEFINNRQLFVYGGYDDGDRFFGDTHIFDLASSSWQELPYPNEPTNPSAREGHCSAVMSDQIIIYGGDSRGGFQSDLHQFDPNRLRWLRPPSLVGLGPGKISDSAMAVGNDGVAVLVGGDTGFSMSKGTYTIEVSQRSEIDAQMLKEMAIERGPDAQVCVVCLDAKVDAMFLWCGHTVCCRMCSRRVKDICPICRQTFSDVVYGICA